MTVYIVTDEDGQIIDVFSNRSAANDCAEYEDGREVGEWTPQASFYN